MSGKSYALMVQFPNVKVKIATNYRSYYNYLTLYFDKIIVKNAHQDSCPVAIEVMWDKDFCSHAYFSTLQNTPAMLQMGANTYVSDERVVTVRKIEKRTKVRIDFVCEEKKITVKGALSWKGVKDSIRYRLLQKAEEEKFFAVTYHLVYYPLFWYYERFLSTHIMHASCIAYNGHGVLLCGLEGIGKTSLSLSLLEDPDVSFISDNLVFFDDHNVYPCFELMRLHKSDNTRLVQGRFEKANAFRTQKDFYAPVAHIPQHGVKPAVCIFLSFCSHMYIKELTVNDAVGNALLLSHLPAELNNYVEYRHLFNLLDVSTQPWASQTTVLKTLFQNTRSYMVGLPKADGLERNTERLKELIKLE